MNNAKEAGRTSTFDWRLLLLLIVAAAAFICIWWLVPPKLYSAANATEEAKLKAITDTRTALLAGLVGIGALGTFWMNSRANQVAKRTYHLTERGQVAERYSRAIGQLGSETVDVRLGGIYTLEQIAEESLRDTDKVTIVEVLSAFIRVHSDPLFRLRKESSPGQPRTVEDERRLAEAYVEDTPLPTDIEAAATVLSRLLPVESARADLAKSSLRGIDLGWREARLTNALLGRADLTKAKLVGANLTNVDFHETKLNDARLEDAILKDAWLVGASLKNADLRGATVKGATFASSRIDGRWSIENGHRLDGPIEANLTGTRFDGTDLTEARLTQRQLNQARGDDQTKVPRDCDRPASWAARGA